MKIKRDKNDILFSKMIRERDGKCVFCRRDEGKLECSHFWGRGNKSVRFDARNCDALCFRCHITHEGNKQGYYREWKLEQLGEELYNDLERRARGAARYGKFEKQMVNESLKQQFNDGAYLEKDWIGVPIKLL